MKVPRPTRLRDEIDSTEDPYIVSQTARAKTEKANKLHQQTLETVRAFLEARSVQVLESKLIDAYALIGQAPAIFEIKSISQSNERDQIRHAVSQLYEYRFLHSIPDASLWVVFSQEPSSQWYIDYLRSDRGINVLWVCGQDVAGPSVSELIRMCSGGVTSGINGRAEPDAAADTPARSASRGAASCEAGVLLS